MRLVEMEREAGEEGEGNAGQGPSPSCSDLHPQCQEQYLACRYMMNICCTDEQNREKALSFSWSVLVRDHTFYLLGQ